MCRFATILIERDSFNENLKGIFEKHSFAFRKYENDTLSHLLNNHFIFINTTTGDCDCGSVLACNPEQVDYEKELEKEIARLKRKKWSDSKIDRYLKQRKPNPKEKEFEEETEKWIKLFSELLENERVGLVGVLIKDYEYSIMDEKFDKIETGLIKLNEINQVLFENLENDRLYKITN